MGRSFDLPTGCNPVLSGSSVASHSSAPEIRCRTIANGIAYLWKRVPFGENVQSSSHRLQTRGPLGTIPTASCSKAACYLDEHSEWQMRGADGGTLNRFCFNSGYLEAMKKIVAEQLPYGIAGCHIDMLDQGFGQPLVMPRWWLKRNPDELDRFDDGSTITTGDNPTLPQLLIYSF